MVNEMKRGAIVLAGGESQRMGQAEAWLPFGRQTLLTRVIEILAHIDQLSDRRFGR